MDLINSNREMITCQVKNKEEINWKEYNDEDEAYNKIYLFSGIEQYGDKEINKKLENTKEDIIINDRIVIITKENLFNFFKDERNEVKEVQILKKLINLNKYYDEIKNETQTTTTPEGWKKCEKRFSNKKEQKKEYKINKFSDIIFKNNVIYFSSEFNSLIQYKKCNDEEFINELKEAYGIK